jgi:hypothetical protein
VWIPTAKGLIKFRGCPEGLVETGWAHDRWCPSQMIMRWTVSAAASPAIPAVLVKLGPLGTGRIADLRPYADMVPDPRAAPSADRRATGMWSSASTPSIGGGPREGDCGVAQGTAGSPGCEEMYLRSW